MAACDKGSSHIIKEIIKTGALEMQCTMGRVLLGCTDYFKVVRVTFPHAWVFSVTSNEGQNKNYPYLWALNDSDYSTTYDVRQVGVSNDKSTALISKREDGRTLATQFTSDFIFTIKKPFRKAVEYPLKITFVPHETIGKSFADLHREKYLMLENCNEIDMNEVEKRFFAIHKANNSAGSGKWD